MTPSEEILSRYSRVEREADALGRIIGVKRLRVSQQTAVSEMTPGLEGMAEIELPDRTVRIARRAQMLIAACVCEIDEHKIPFPKTRQELDAIADRLDEEGIVAAMVAYSRVNGAQKDQEGTIEAAKK